MLVLFFSLLGGDSKMARRGRYTKQLGLHGNGVRVAMAACCTARPSLAWLQDAPLHPWNVKGRRGKEEMGGATQKMNKQIKKRAQRACGNVPVFTQRLQRETADPMCG
ncbi:hypothetical protein CRENBAI_026528 [Crenichthys baileyi]|uniref:Uncharacterized protein n=1 Tax=Crenichthys baileyi TaxID=28760 RepID=A0AAV9R857_9TELE